MRLKSNLFNLQALGEIERSDVAGILGTGRFWMGLFGIIGTVSGIFLLMHFIIFPWYTYQGRTLEVPNVLRMPQEQALAALEDAGFQVETHEQFHRPEFKVGQVAEQRPAAGSLVKPGRRILIFINSESKRYVEVPNIVNLLEKQGEGRLKEMGLSLGNVKVDSTSRQERGTIIRQDPIPRTSVKTGTPITVWVSLNYMTPPLPNLSGMTISEATAELKEMDLRLSVAYNDGKTTRITNHTPGAGSRLRINDVIRVFLGSPPVEPEFAPPASSDLAPSRNKPKDESSTTEKPRRRPERPKSELPKPKPKVEEPTPDAAPKPPKPADDTKKYDW